MKIAVACDGLSVSSHAARCESFMCYLVEKGIITDCRNLPNMGVTSQEGAKLITDLGFDTIITGGIDMDMATALCSAGVEVVAGAKGTAREVMDAYLSDTLMGDTVELCGLSSEEDEDFDRAFDQIFNNAEANID